MKSKLFLITGALSLFVAAIAGATTRTVNNTLTFAYNPGQYNSISTAITASSDGDTILVAGSSIAYDAGSVTFNKRLVLIGPGYNPQNQDRLPATVSGGFTIYTTSNGSTIMGMTFIGGIGQNGIITGFTFRRNYFNSSVNLNNNSVANILFAENVIGANGGLYFHNSLSCPNVVIRNNVFAGDLNAPSGNQRLQLPYGVATVACDTVDHNLFLNGKYGSTSGSLGIDGNWGFLIARNAYITNNIFMNYSPLATNNTGSGSSFINNYFFNNIEYRSATTILTMPQGANYGSGNLNNINPLINTIFSNATNIYLDFGNDNLRLATGSPCINAGTDGTDIGPTGGRYPIYLSTNTYLTGEPMVPSIRSLTITSSTTVVPGASISVSVSAKKIN